MKRLYLMAILGACSQAGEWPQWRGPNADGVAGRRPPSDSLEPLSNAGEALEPESR